MNVTRIGLDLAKNVFQVHGVDRDERVVIKRQLKRGQVLGYFEKLPRAGSAWRRAPVPTAGHGRSVG